MLFEYDIAHLYYTKLYSPRARLFCKIVNYTVVKLYFLQAV